MRWRKTRLAKIILLLTVVTLIVGAKTADNAPPPTVQADLRRADAVGVKKAPILQHGVFRFTSYPVAWTAAQKSHRPILIFVTSPSCPHCTRMISQTYRTARIKRMIGGSFESVYVDRSKQPKLAAKLNVRWFPTTIVVAPNNKVIDVIEGYVDSSAFSQRLQTHLASTTVNQATVKTAERNPL